MKKILAVNFAAQPGVNQEGRIEIMPKSDESPGLAAEERLRSVDAPIPQQLLHSSDPFRVDYRESTDGLQICVERLNPGILKREQFGPMANAFRDLLTVQCPGLVERDARKGSALFLNVNPVTESDKQTIRRIIHFLLDKSMFILRKDDPPTASDSCNEYVNYYSAIKFPGTNSKFG